MCIIDSYTYLQTTIFNARIESHNSQVLHLTFSESVEVNILNSGLIDSYSPGVASRESLIETLDILSNALEPGNKIPVLLIADIV